MEYNHLLFLTSFDEKGYGLRAWKGMDWDVMNRLHKKGYIGNPKSKAKSAYSTEEGTRLSEAFFKKHFGISS